ncbi:hypothetical protein BDV33DRAFT_176127, partial [Aspergillus novoparasiticus]
LTFDHILGTSLLTRFYNRVGIIIIIYLIVLICSFDKGTKNNQSAAPAPVWPFSAEDKIPAHEKKRSYSTT